MANNINNKFTTSALVKAFFRVGLILAVLFCLGLATMIVVVWQGSRWLIGSYNTQNRNLNANISKPLTTLQNLFEPKTPEPAVKIVSEESQVIDVVKRASPAVVSIIASADVPKMEQCATQNITPINPNTSPELNQLFSITIPSFCQKGTQKKRVAAGSGFLVSYDGYIITNKHVVADEKAEYTVVLSDAKHFGNKLKAVVLARDPNNDIAVLKVTSTDNLPYLKLGDSNKLQVGQTAIAIGYALGEFDNTVTKGVVSGLFRTIQASGSGQNTEDLRGLIQTDAAINLGNSGGPLLNIAGNVIGVNVATADAQSIGFAIPVNIAKTGFSQVKKTGAITKADQAFLGIRYVPITSEIQSANNLPYDYGMLVGKGQAPGDVAVVPGSPAEKAKIAENDIILEANGLQLNERRIISDVLADKKPGDIVNLKVYHQGEIKTIKVVLGKRPN